MKLNKKERIFFKKMEQLYGKEYVEAEKRRLAKWEKHNDVAQIEKAIAESQSYIKEVF